MSGRRTRHQRTWSVCTLVTAVLALIALATVGARPSDARPGGAADPLPLEPTGVELIEATTFVAPVDVATLALDLDDVPPGATLDLRLHPATTDRDDFLATVGGEDLRSVLRTYRDLPVDDLPRDADGVVRLELQIVDGGAQPLAGFRIDEPGVYPLSIEIDDADGNEVDRLVTHLVRLPAADDPDAGIPLATSVVVQVIAPTATRPDGTMTLDDAAAAGALRAIDAVASVPGLPLTLAPVPETLDALSDRGAVEALALGMDGRQALADTYVPIESASWTLAGRPDVLVDQLVLGSAVIGSALSVPVPTTTWLVDPTVDPAALDVLHRSGTTSAVVPEPLLAPLDPRDFPVTMTSTFDVLTSSGAPVRSIMADEGLRLRLTSSAQPALAANRTLAELAILALDDPELARGAVLLVPGGADTPRGLGPVLVELARVAEPLPGASSLLTPVTVDALLDAVPPARDPEDEERILVRSWTADAPPPLDGLPQALDDAQQAIDSYRSMLAGEEDDAVRLAQDLVDVAPDRRLEPPAQHAHLDGATTVVATRTAAVSAPEQGTVTVTADEASIPLVLDNGLDVPVDVAVHLQADKLEFPDGDRFVTTLVPGTNRLEIQVRTRASGAFPLEVALTSPDDELLLDETRVQVRSTAVSGLGLVLSVGAGLFLAAWWARNLRSSRRRRRLVGADNHPTKG